MKNPDEAIEHYQLAKKDRTMNSEAEKLFDAIADWKSNDGWQFADKEAAWKFFFTAGAASRDAEIAELVAALALKDEAIAECLEHWVPPSSEAQIKQALAKVRRP